MSIPSPGIPKNGLGGMPQPPLMVAPPQAIGPPMGQQLSHE